MPAFALPSARPFAWPSDSQAWYSEWSVLCQRVKSSVEHTMRSIAEHDGETIVREITSGNLAGMRLPGHDSTASKALALASFVSDYQALFLTAAALLTTASFSHVVFC